jgi:protein-tyrosine-phosphatase
MKRRGIDISHHRARNIASIDLSEYETAIAMDREVAALFRTAFPEFEDLRIWNIPDPYGGSATQYQRAAGLIRDRVEDLLRGLG